MQALVTTSFCGGEGGIDLLFLFFLPPCNTGLSYLHISLFPACLVVLAIQQQRNCAEISSQNHSIDLLKSMCVYVGGECVFISVRMHICVYTSSSGMLPTHVKTGSLILLKVTY